MTTLSRQFAANAERNLRGRAAEDFAAFVCFETGLGSLAGDDERGRIARTDTPSERC